MFHVVAWCGIALVLAGAEQRVILFAVPDIYSQHSEGPAESSATTEQAEASFVKSRKAIESGDVGTALRHAAHTLMLEPNHADARRMWGYQKQGNHWAGSFALGQLSDGQVWHPKFGWIGADEVARFEAGQRKFGKRWISAADDERRHASIDDGWRIRTDHFLVTTNHSRQAAAELAARLEQTSQIWLQLCGDFFIEPEELQKRLAGKEISGARNRPFRVVYYRNRSEYNAALLRQQPRIGMTLGIYFDTTRTAHFFAGEDQDPGTISHEAVHQFFQESAPAARNVGGLANAWIIEGIACYFESLTPVQLGENLTAFSIGTPDAGRLPAAYQRRITDGFYVPLEDLSRLGATDLQRRSDIAKLYSQSAGLATFFMHYHDGKYRPALMKLLQFVYAGRDKPTTLAEVTGQSFADLDQQYQEFLEEGARR